MKAERGVGKRFPLLKLLPFRVLNFASPFETSLKAFQRAESLVMIKFTVTRAIHCQLWYPFLGEIISVDFPPTEMNKHLHFFVMVFPCKHHCFVHRYPYVCHAELNAIINATAANLKGCTMYARILCTYPRQWMFCLCLCHGISSNSRSIMPSQVIVPSVFL